MSKRILFIFVLCTFILKHKAQFLDKKFYLIDSIEKKETNKNDFILIDNNLKKYHSTNSDTVKLNLLSEIVEGGNDQNIWIRYNRLLYIIADELAKKEQNKFLKNKFLSKKAQAINNYAFYVQND